MLALLRQGFWRDSLALLILTVLLGAALVATTARGVQGYFEGAVSGLVGAPGEFDLIVHMVDEAGEEGVAALARRLEELAPGTKLKEGPVLAGRANILVGFPSNVKGRALFESVQSYLRDVPGYDGIAYIVEPSVLVRDVHPGVVDKVTAMIDGYPEVHFSFQSGESVWAVLRFADDAHWVQAALERDIQSLGIVDVRLPVTMDGLHLDEAKRLLIDELNGRMDLAAAMALPRHEPSQMAADLEQVRLALQEMSGDGPYELRRSLWALADQLEQASEFTQMLSDDQGGVGAALSMFSQTVDQIELLQDRLRSVVQQFQGTSGSGVTDLVLALLLQNVIDGWADDTESSTPPSVDSTAMKEGIEALFEQIEALGAIDLTGLAASLREVDAAFPQIDSAAIDRIVAVLDRLVEADGAQGDRLEVLIEGEWKDASVRQAVADVVGQGSADIYLRHAGVVQPDARTELLQVMERAQSVVAVLAALLIAVIFYFLDVAAVLSFLLRTEELAKGGIGTGLVRRARWKVRAIGGAWMAVVLTAMIALAGALRAGLGAELLLAAGFVIGFLLTVPLNRIHPVDGDQVQAAQSLGLAEADILREVVIPAGRPGLLSWLGQHSRRLGTCKTSRREGRRPRIARDSIADQSV